MSVGRYVKPVDGDVSALRKRGCSIASQTAELGLPYNEVRVNFVVRGA